MSLHVPDFTKLMNLGGGPKTSETLQHLVQEAERSAQGASEPDQLAACHFADSALEFLTTLESSLDQRVFLAALELTGRILFFSTERHRHLLAGTKFFQLLSSATKRLDGPRPRTLVPRDGGRTVCHLATEIYELGGHTRVIEDFIRLAPDHRHVVIITNPNNLDPDQLRRAIRANVKCELRIMQGSDDLVTLRSIAAMLEEIGPSSLIASAHPYDPLVPMLLTMFDAKRKLHVHHADHSFSLVPNARDIPIALLFPGASGGLERTGINNFVYLPVCCADPRQSVPVDVNSGLPRAAAGLFTTSTSGSPNKFEPRAGASADYLDLLATRYAARSGRHVHFGPLQEAMHDRIRQLVAGLHRESDFINVPFVSSLSRALALLKPDLYIGSYPLGGKLASVEAMAAACPIAAWQKEGYHSAAEIIYPEQLRWNDLAELGSIVRGLTEEAAERQRKYSRQYYELNYSEANLRRRWLPFLNGSGKVEASAAD